MSIALQEEASTVQISGCKGQGACPSQAVCSAGLGTELGSEVQACSG